MAPSVMGRKALSSNRHGSLCGNLERRSAVEILLTEQGYTGFTGRTGTLGSPPSKEPPDTSPSDSSVSSPDSANCG